MIRTVSKCCAYLSVAAFLVMCSGCSGREYAKRQFILEASRQTGTAAQSSETVLAVRRFTIDPAFGPQGLVYRKSESEYEVDFYNEFLVAPEIIISGQVRNWLSQSGLFKTVLDPGSLIEATHVLEGNVLALYGDFREPASPQAVIQIRVFLIPNQPSKEGIILTRDYQASHDVEVATPEALVGAFNECLERICSDLEDDLRKGLQP